MEVSRPAQQHEVQGGGARVRRASDPGHEPFTLPVPEGRMGLIWDGGPGGRGVEGGERGAVSEAGLTPRGRDSSHFWPGVSC